MTFDFDRVYDRTPSESGKWHTYAPDVLPMYVADMDFRSPDVIIDALRRRVDHGFFGYGKVEPEFNGIVRDRLKRRYGWEVEEDAIVTLPGVIPGFSLAIKLLAADGDRIIMHTPTYGPILHAPEHYGMLRAEAALRQDDAGRYEVDWESWESALDTNPRVFLLCNPHNPTGRVFTRAELERMARGCLERDIPIVSDEIHCDLVFRGHEHIPIASLSPEAAANSITLMAPSKTFNLPGLKAAIGVIPNKELRERFETARGDLVKAINILGYTAMLAAYREADPWLDELIPYLEANRAYLASFIDERLPGVRLTPAEATYLAWLDVRDLGLNDPAAFFREEAKVALSDGANFGESGKGFVRLNFGCPRPLLEEGLARIASALERRAASA